jgi:hypothetical protein
MWPNKRLKRGTKQTYIPIDDITQSELSLGFVRIISDRVAREAERGDSATISTAMLAFMEQWCDDVRDFPFSTVIGYVKAVFFDLEQGRIRWTDADQLRAIRTRAIEKSDRLQSDAKSSSQSATPAAKPRQTRWCAEYNNGTCTYTTAHKSKYGHVSHICKFCFDQLGREFKHRLSECNNKDKQVKSVKN